MENYVIDSQNIVRHKFVPLLHRVLTQRKFRPDESAPKNSSGKRIRTNKGKKERHIYYPSHLDSIIYSYYNDILTQAYERYLSDKDYASVAVAYRRIPKTNCWRVTNVILNLLLMRFNLLEIISIAGYQ